MTEAAEVGLSARRKKPGVMTHHAIPALGRLRLDDGEIQTSLDYIVRHRLKKNKQIKGGQTGMRSHL